MPKSLKLLLVMIGSLAFTIFVFRHQPFDIGIWGAVATMMAIIYVPFAIPSVGTFIVNRPRKVFWTGVVVASIGLIGPLVAIFASGFYGVPQGITGDDAISKAMIYVMMAGISLTVLPRSVAAQKRLHVADSKRAEKKPKLHSASSIRDGWNANIFTVRQLRPFLRIAGPWIALLWVVPFVGLHLAAYLRGFTPALFAPSSIKVDVPTVLFGEQFPNTIVTAIAYPTVLVGWHRFVLEQRLPRIAALPDMAAMRYLFRLWMIVLMVGIIVVLTVSNAPDLARLLGMSDNLPATAVILILVLCLFVYRGSQFALVLSAIATANRNFLGAESAYVTRRLGMTYPIGFVASLLPFGLLAVASAVAIYYLGLSRWTLNTSLTTYALRLIPMTATFLALSSCATFLSWVYAQRSKEYAETISAPQTI